MKFDDDIKESDERCNAIKTSRAVERCNAILDESSISKELLISITKVDVEAIKDDDEMITKKANELVTNHGSIYQQRVDVDEPSADPSVDKYIKQIVNDVGVKEVTVFDRLAGIGGMDDLVFEDSDEKSAMDHVLLQDTARDLMSPSATF